MELILQDNAYQPITQPVENDIVIYRSEDGRILHTGLVRVILPDSTILIESKWGLQAVIFIAQKINPTQP
ncbi:MAG: hypothetical protein U0930_13835 [Pirellulales bacterium]